MPIHFDFASWQSAGQPLYVSQFERQKYKTDSMVNIHCTFWVQKVVRCSISNIFCKSSSHCLVHPKKILILLKDILKDVHLYIYIHYIPDHGIVGVYYFAISWLSQSARVSNHCTSMATGGEWPEVHSGWGNDFEHLCHYFFWSPVITRLLKMLCGGQRWSQLKL